MPPTSRTHATNNESEHHTMTSTALSMQQMLHDTIVESHGLFNRFLAGFNQTNHTTQAEGLPNHAAWSLGHCALVMHRVAAALDGNDLPDTDFITGDGTQGDADHFDTEGVFINSTPVDDPSQYPTWERCQNIFDDAVTRLAQAALNAPDEILCAESPWLDRMLPRWQLAQRVLLHNAVHSGQLIDLRRALNFDSVIVLPDNSN